MTRRLYRKIYWYTRGCVQSALWDQATYQVQALPRARVHGRVLAQVHERVVWPVLERLL